MTETADRRGRITQEAWEALLERWRASAAAASSFFDELEDRTPPDLSCLHPRKGGGDE